MNASLLDKLLHGTLLGDGGYLIELERRGYVRSGSDQEKVGTGKGSGTFTPEVAIEHPAALRGLHEEFLRAGSQVLQALTFFATRAKLDRSGYGKETEAINHAAVKIAREVAGDRALVAGSVSRTQLFEREGPGASSHARDLLREQIAFLKEAGADFLILETFFRVDEMRIALEEGKRAGLPMMATMSLRPQVTATSDGVGLIECARILSSEGAILVGLNCEQEPARMLPALREMKQGLTGGARLAAQPAAFRTTEDKPYFTGMAEFPDAMETIQIPRGAFTDFGRAAQAEGIAYLGGCCGANAAFIRAVARGLSG